MNHAAEILPGFICVAIAFGVAGFGSNVVQWVGSGGKNRPVMRDEWDRRLEKRAQITQDLIKAAEKYERRHPAKLTEAAAVATEAKK